VAQGMPAGQGNDQRLWLGLNDAAVRDTYVWEGGCASGYTHYQSGEPNHAATSNNEAGGEHYMVMVKVCTYFILNPFSLYDTYVLNPYPYTQIPIYPYTHIPIYPYPYTHTH
jgi:hypothetical protein